MILLAALILGLLAGWGLARWRKQPYRAPHFKHLWLVLAAFVPQALVSYVPGTWDALPGWIAAALLPCSLVVFLAFVWLNRAHPGMPVLLAGLLLNLIVISANGGLMPISPETAMHLPGGDPGPAGLGSRFGVKDVLLRAEDTRLAALSDRFLLPSWFRYQVAFSLGDTLVAAGAFWLLAKPAEAT